MVPVFEDKGWKMSILESVLESRLEQQCRILAGNNSCKLVKIQGNRGWPDRILLVPGGAMMFLEFKREGAPLRPLQEHILKELQQMGFQAERIDNYNSFQIHLKALQQSSGSRTATKPAESTSSLESPQPSSFRQAWENPR